MRPPCKRNRLLLRAQGDGPSQTGRHGDVMQAPLRGLTAGADSQKRWFARTKGDREAGQVRRKTCATRLEICFFSGPAPKESGLLVPPGKSLQRTDLARREETASNIERDRAQGVDIRSQGRIATDREQGKFARMAEVKAWSVDLWTSVRVIAEQDLGRRDTGVKRKYLPQPHPSANVAVTVTAKDEAPGAGYFVRRQRRDAGVCPQPPSPEVNPVDHAHHRGNTLAWAVTG